MEYDQGRIQSLLSGGALTEMKVFCGQFIGAMAGVGTLIIRHHG